MKKLFLSAVTVSAIIATSAIADVTVKSKAAVLKFSGKHYLGFVHDNSEGKESNSYFETRRNYLQVKAYFEENSKDYMRLTLDTKTTSSGDVNVRLKYAYLYLDNLFANTGVEIGQVHRPWIDYESKSSWFYRSVAKSFIEEKAGANLTNSADKGVNFKTKLNHFSSEVAIVNGEGYGGQDNDGKNGLSYELRLTSHLYKSDKSTYADVSFTAQHNTKTLENDKDLTWYGLHAVYNQPEFLLAGMFVTTDKTGKGWSINGEYRPIPKTSIFARYDTFKADNNKKREEYIAGLAYDYTKNIKLLANIFHADKDTNTDNNAKNKYMITAEVKW